MERKPWPIIVLATLHIVEPLFKVLFFCWFAKLSLAEMMHHFQTVRWYVLMAFWLPFPLLGIAILAIKRWSIPVIVIIELLAIGNHVWTWTFAKRFIPYSVTFTLLNSLVLAYFLIPSVRRFYWNASLRWWETAPRFQTDWPARLVAASQEFKTEILAISETGCLVSGNGLPAEGNFQLKFHFGGIHFSFPCRVANATSKKEVGILFGKLTRAEATALRKTLTALDLLQYRRRPPRVSWFTGFRNWAYRLVTTGKGFFPEPQKA